MLEETGGRLNMNTVLKVLILGIATLLAPSFAAAAPDRYVGDTAI